MKVSSGGTHLGEPHINDAEVVVVIFGALLHLNNLLLQCPLLTLVFEHLAHYGILLVSLNGLTVSGMLAKEQGGGPTSRSSFQGGSS